MLTALAVSGYRSLRDLVVPLGRLTLVTGPNGSGRSNLYRALRLLADTAQGRVIGSLAREGGLDPVLWAGPVLKPSAMLVDRRGPPVRSRDGGDWTMLAQDLATFDSAMTQCADPRGTPELLMLREGIRGWRFYDRFRADAASPARLPRVGTHTPECHSITLTKDFGETRAVSSIDEPAPRWEWPAR